MFQPPNFSPRRRLALNGVGALLVSTSLLAVGCSHPSIGTGSGGNTSNDTGGSGDSPGNTGGSGQSNGGTGGSGQSNGGTGGSSVMILDGGSGDGTGGTAPAKSACNDDPNQQKALSYTPGFTLSAADKTAADNAVSSMDLTTKIKQLRGPNTSGYDDIFRTEDAGGVKGFQFRDGPRGVNLDAVKGSGKGYSTVFPVAASRGATFDVDLEYKLGQAMGDELIASGATMLLAPTVNILRHPAWGRAQETYGEDSFLLGRLGSAYTVGVQEYAPACVKHYAANNVERDRATDVAAMDEQTLQEVYARHFGMIIQDTGVACVMAAYNLVDNGSGAKNCTQSKHLLTDILRTQYGFQGMVLSDWWAMPGGQSAPQNTWADNAREAITAGMDMELPWNLQFQGLSSLTGIEPTVTTSAQRVVETKYRFKVNSTSGAIGLKKPTSQFDSGSFSITNADDHIALAEKAAIEGTVLLKNDGNVLPIKSDVKTVAVIGTQVNWSTRGTNASGTINFSADARIGDLGSSRVNADPAKTISPCKGFKDQAPSSVTVVCGDGSAGAGMAKNADVIVVVAGLTPEDEGEEYTITPEDADRGASLALDGKSGGKAQNDFINMIATANPGKPIAVILQAGSAIDVSSFISKVSALVMAWYPGQSGGAALAKLFYGKDKSGAAVNFSGKLPITWPASLADEPTFSGSNHITQMGYYLGYRWFDTQKKTPLYAFGAGLSYTTFEYSNLVVPCSTATAKSVVKVSVDVKNTGTVDGEEIVMLFAGYPGSKNSNRAAAGYKELKGFQRVALKAGEKARVTIPVRVSDLWYWDTAAKASKVEPGMVKVMVGGSSDKLPLSDSFTVQ